jgi:hypothetical protein
MVSRDATTICKYTSAEKEKTSSILLKSSVRGLKPGPEMRHALWTEAEKKILKIDRFLAHLAQLFLFCGSSCLRA